MPQEQTIASIPEDLFSGIDDVRFLTGRSMFVDDFGLHGCDVAVMLRSPHAHARILSLDAARAKAMSGVTVILAGDLAGISAIPSTMRLTNTDGTSRSEAPWPILAKDTVRYQGEIVACLVAPSRQQALDALENIQIEYEALEAVTEIEQAVRRHSLRLHPGQDPNLCFDWSYGNKSANDEIFAKADRVTRLTVRNNRIAPTPLETRGAIGAYDPVTKCHRLIAGTQNSHLIRRVLAECVFNVPLNEIDVVTPDVGGGFGSKLFVYPEYVLVLWAARALGRPVKWVAERSEAFQSDTYGRDRVMSGELALTKEGRFLGIRFDSLANLGAYLSLYGSFTAAECGVSVLNGAYAMESVYARARGFFTNTVPVDAYRGAGRPETIYLVERLVDQAAEDLNIGRDAIRAMNLLGAKGFPAKTATGYLVDSGNFLSNQTNTLEQICYESLEQRKSLSRKNGKLRGLGFSHYLETNGGFGVSRHVEHEGRARETAAIKFEADGQVFISVGTQSTGQPHTRGIITLVAQHLGISPQRVFAREGGTLSTRAGGGTGGSRSTLAFSQATFGVIDAALKLGCQVAATELDCPLEDVRYSDGAFRSARRNVTVDLFELAGRHPGLMDTEVSVNLSAVTYPTGCHACEIEIDIATGVVEILRYVATDDFGTLLNRDAVQGQVTGGIAQGIGQALGEQCRFDPASGQLLTGSLLDYHIPRAADIPAIEWYDNGSVCKTNSLGLKGCGESGSSAAPPTVINAIIDALKGHVPSDRVQMPATSHHIWSLLRSAD